MNVGEAAFAGCGIAQVTHVELAGEFGIHMLEHLGDGVLAFCTLTEHIFVAWYCI